MALSQSCENLALRVFRLEAAPAIIRTSPAKFLAHECRPTGLNYPARCQRLRGLLTHIYNDFTAGKAVVAELADAQA